MKNQIVKKSKLRTFCGLAGVFLICAVLLFRGRQEQMRALSLDGLEAAVIAYVIDGDTVIVSQDGVESKIRLLGIDCEESVSREAWKNTEKGDRASAFTRSLLPTGKVVYLQKDQSETDRYDRKLRYLWLEVPEDLSSEKEVKEKMVNAILLMQNMASTMDMEPDMLYSDLFHRLEDSVIISPPSSDTSSS